MNFNLGQPPVVGCPGTRGGESKTGAKAFADDKCYNGYGVKIMSCFGGLQAALEPASRCRQEL